MDQNSILLVQKTFKKTEAKHTTIAENFYQKLFELDPKLKKLFPYQNEESMRQQGDKLMMMLTGTVDGLKNFEKLIPILELLGKRHADYRVTDYHYDIVGSALISTLAEQIGDDFTLQVELAWYEFYNTLTSIMKKAAYN